MADASLDDWDLTVIRLGRATRDRPAGVLLRDLTVDLTDLKKTIERRRSASVLRRLTRVAAHMSGLMCLTLCKLDDRAAFYRWARTARSAANEAGDVLTFSWVLAQEAYGHYYSGDLPEAIEVARYAQKIVPRTPCVGSALAAALEARAHALMGRHRETREALARAEEIVGCLKGEELASSAFGYNEAQLRFHEGNAYTHLADMAAATKAQDRALQLCAPGDYTDWSMIRLDRASCLARSGDAIDAISYAMETLTKLTEPQRQGIITLRAREIVDGLPTVQRTLPAVRELHELLMITT
jgi:tetratricopeptide (TPR) repeat protein